MKHEGKEVFEMAPHRVFCPGHGEVLRAQWPKGYAIASVRMFQAATRDGRIWKEVEQLAPTAPNDENARIKALNRITEKKPLCYFVAREEIRKIYGEIKIATMGRCAACGQSGLGVTYQLSTPMGIQETWMCFECILTTGENMHRAHPHGKVWPQR